MTAVSLALLGVFGYLGAGLLVGLPFVARGVDRTDPSARGAGVAFRLVILPGVVALWPLLALRWWRAGEGCHDS